MQGLFAGAVESRDGRYASGCDVFEEAGEVGLASLSRRPHRMPDQKADSAERNLILQLRKQSNWGACRIQSERRREHEMSLSLDTTHKILMRSTTRQTNKSKRRIASSTCNYKCWPRRLPQANKRQVIRLKTGA